MKRESMKDKPGERGRQGRRRLSRILQHTGPTGAAVLAMLWLSQGGLAQGSSSQAMPLADAPSASLATVLGILGLMLANALCVAAGTAIGLLRPSHAKLLKEANPKQAQRIEHLLREQARYSATCSLGDQASRLGIVLLAFLLAPGLLRWFSETWGWAGSFPNLVLTVILIMIPVGLVHLVAAELIPKSFAALHPTRTAVALYRFTVLVSGLFALPAALVTGIAGLITARFGGKATFALPNMAEEEIKTLVESAEESGQIEAEERELLHSVFDFADTVAREVMTPRVDMDALSVRSDPSEVMRVIQDHGRSRIPLYEETDDQIVGIIHAKDLLLAMLQGRAPNLRTLMRPAMFVPETKPVSDLLREMRANRAQLAIVQDEYGGTAGLVTIEDIVEELVGDIVDEYDVEEPEIVAEEGGWLVDARTHIDDLNDEIQSELDSGEFDTIGGYVFGMFGRQPKMGESVEAEGFRFTVVQTDGRRILRLRVQKVEKSELPETADAEA